MNPPNYWWRFQALKGVVVDLFDWLFMFSAVNLVWFLLSLTMIGLPPATVALFDIAYGAYRGRYPTVRRYLPLVRERLLTGWLWAGMNLLIVILGWSALQFYSAQGSTFSTFVGGIIFFSAILLLVFQFYLLPYIAIQDKTTVLQAYRNAIMTALADPYLLLFNSGLSLFILIPSIVVVAPLMLITPMFIALLGTYSLLEWLQHRGVIEPIVTDDNDMLQE